MWTLLFWKKTAERAVKSAGQGIVLALGAGLVNAWDADWKQVAGVGLGMAVLSVGTSMASIAIGPDDDPSVV
jgi:Putative lactococcus lactis phage r1t holin